MNHLQVISGLLQLKKYDRAGEYIKQVAEKLNRSGVLARLGSPEVVAAVLTGELEAGKKGIPLIHTIGTDMENGVSNAAAAAEIVRGMLDLAVSRVPPAGLTPEGIDLEINEQNKDYVFRVSFPGLEEAGNIAASPQVALLEELAARIGGTVTVAIFDGGVTVITLAVPSADQGK